MLDYVFPFDNSCKITHGTILTPRRDECPSVWLELKLALAYFLSNL